AFDLLSSFTVLSLAQEVAAERVSGATGHDDPRVSARARNLVLTEDFAVRQRLTKYLRGRLEAYDDTELAALIATKRLGDYTTSLEERNVLSMDAPATYGWILHHRARNAAVLDGATVNAMLVDGAMPDLVRFAKETLA
ncbi:hypothetical protein, partial [Tsukamurella sputi]|uniref:hypothetical protein n=1 Tax=Tsukamurella sputi TaxID=2591848 RepID=UPI0013156966